MNKIDKQTLLARLAKGNNQIGGENPWNTVAATSPNHGNSDTDQRLDGLLERINDLAAGRPSEARPAQPAPTSPVETEDTRYLVEQTYEVLSDKPDAKGEFFPIEPQSCVAAGLPESHVEGLIMKFLLARGDASGRQISNQIKLPFVMVEELMRRMKMDQQVAYRDAGKIGDYVYQLSDVGRERAKRYTEDCSYFGAAPVSLRDYCESIKLQSLQTQHPSEQDLKRAFEDILINKNMLNRLGPAVNSGKGMFLFGYPGNGKTSIAERVTKAFGQYIWIPRAIGVDGEIIRVFDPNHHDEAPLRRGDGLLDQSKLDKRWVRVRRPTIVVGGELTMDNLELSVNRHSNINEAPVQMKSNCGTLVIDDFGRQKMSTDELLNRWIVPLEKRYDFLNLPSGKTIQVPFDQLVIFSTNLEPRDLVDGAFLRRIPYKIEVLDPTEDEFRELFKIMCPIMGFEYQQDTIQYLIETHYKVTERPFRCCHPRDLLLQVKNNCLYRNKPQLLSNDDFDFAVENYFSAV